MSDSHDSVFIEIIRRAQKGDEQAADELLNTYLPQVRRYVRIRLNSKLRREMDSLDVCQSVFGNFFVQLALGKFDLESPEQLIRLLATMSRNRLINHVDMQEAKIRDVKRLLSAPVEEFPIHARDATASQVVMAKEILENVRERLTPDERRICDDRVIGLSWEEIAQNEGKSADAIRKQHARALERISGSLGLSVIDFRH